MSRTALRFDQHFVDLLEMVDDEALLHGSGADGPDTHPARYAEWADGAGVLRRTDLSHTVWRGALLDMAEVLGELVGPEDVVVVAAPYELSFAGATFERAVELIGAAVIGVGTSDTICPKERLLDLVRRYDATVLVCDPQRACDLAALETARGGDPATSSITRIVAVGAPCAGERLRRIGQEWGAEVSALFSTPTMPLVAVSCPAGGHHVRGHRFEVSLRSATPGRLLPGAQRGELMLRTHGALVRPAQPTGELVELVPGAARCACGRPGPVLLPLGTLAAAVGLPAGPVSAVDVETILHAGDDLPPGLTVRAEPPRFATQAAGATVSDPAVLRELLDRVDHELDIEVLMPALPHTGPANTHEETS